MICRARLARLAQWESPGSCKCPRGCIRIGRGCADLLGQGPRHKSFFSQAGEYCCSTAVQGYHSDLEAYFLLCCRFCVSLYMYINRYTLAAYCIDNAGTD